jgi:hypothetical protein
MVAPHEDSPGHAPADGDLCPIHQDHHRAAEAQRRDLPHPLPLYDSLTAQSSAEPVTALQNGDNAFFAGFQFS